MHPFQFNIMMYAQLHSQTWATRGEEQKIDIIIAREEKQKLEHQKSNLIIVKAKTKSQDLGVNVEG